MIFVDKNVCVIGAGVSGIAASNLLRANNAKVILYDKKEQNVNKCNIDGVKTLYGDFPLDMVNTIDVFVMSPGVSLEQDYLDRARELNIPILGEIELAYACSKGKIVAITGTNGKTTTTALVGEIMKSYYDEVYIVGNIGVPYTGIALQTTENAIIVAEVSSYQLETIHDFKPVASAVLNVTPDHLVRHKTMDNYANVKASVFKNQTEESLVVLNYDDEYTRAMAQNVVGNVCFFSRKNKLKDGIYLDEEEIILAENGRETKICNVSDLKLFGMHNIENVMAAVGLSLYMGVPLTKVIEVITCFKGVEHRIEWVRELKGVTYYNDSKATNPDSAIKGIEAMFKRTVLIGGGMDKKLPNAYDEWVKLFKDKVAHLVLFGETKYDIADTAKKYGFTQFTIVDTLEEAVKISADMAEEGEAVLLSPACASWDMFESFEERGTLFKKYVNELE